MAKRKKKHRLPYWVRSQNFRFLNNSEKDFLGYLYYFGPDTCWMWNCRLQLKFHRCRRTIQYWLAKLKKLGFIWIENPFGNERKIHARMIPSPEHWLKLYATTIFAKTTSRQGRRSKKRRGLPPPIRKHSSAATIDQAWRDIVMELVRRGETMKTAEKVADGVIAKSKAKLIQDTEKKGV